LRKVRKGKKGYLLYDSLGLPLVSCNAYFVGGVLLEDK
jgi:hypothetical protein